MSSSRAFASLSSSLLARKGGARPAMRSALQGQPDGRPHDPLGDLGWNDMGDDGCDSAEPQAASPSSEPTPRHPEPVVTFDSAPGPFSAGKADPLLARKPAPAEVVPFVREVPAVRPAAVAPLTLLIGQTVLRRTRPAAFTLRLDPDRHYRLRTACVLQKRSAQSIVTEAVDQFLDALPELEPLGTHAAAQLIA